jgi:toluene monooxygenase system ferredoxin subunit
VEVQRERDDWQVACDAADLDGEEMLECRVGDRDILLVRMEDHVVACPAICPHMEERLAFGFVEGNVLTCSKHLWQWDLRSGAPIGLAEQPLGVAPVRIEEGRVFVDIAALACEGPDSCN